MIDYGPDGEGLETSQSLPVDNWIDNTIYEDTRTEARESETSKPGCEGCEHWQQQFAVAIESYRSLQDALIGNMQKLCEQQEQMVMAFNTIGSQQQQMWDGIGNIMKFFNGIGADLKTMTMADKIRVMRELMGDK